MSLEQLMLLASQLAQAPRPAGTASAPTTASMRGRHGKVSASAALSAEELEALQQIWTQPSASQPVESGPRVYH